MAADPIDFLLPWKLLTISPLLFQVHRFTETSIVLSYDFQPIRGITNYL